MRVAAHYFVALHLLFGLFLPFVQRGFMVLQEKTFKKSFIIYC